MTSNKRSGLLYGLLCVLSLLVLVACEPSHPKLVATDITGADFAQSFSLTDHTGKPRKLEDFKGKVVALFFGYTHCPDVCPTTMADMANALKVLKADGDKVQVLFVTLDPERDTREVLAKFVPSFDSRFIGLFGTPEQTEAVAKDFKIYFKKQSDDGHSNYTIDHSAGVYVFDGDGKIRLYLKFGEKPNDIASDIRQIM